MNPSRNQIPNRVSEDRRRARRATRRIEQKRIEFEKDSAPLYENMRRLPPHARQVPRDVDFHAWQKVSLGLEKIRMQVKSNYASLRTALSPFDDGQSYEKLYRLLFDAEGAGRWRGNEEFVRKRLDGVNPMQLRRLDKELDPDLWKTAKEALSSKHGKDIEQLRNQGLLYFIEYNELWERCVQEEVLTRRPGVSLAAPTALFWSDGEQLWPLAIQLKPSGNKPNPVFTPWSSPSNWLMAQAHLAAADGHMHEGVSHLLETHLVNEAIALCMYRQFHPDHPLRQLLEPHYQGTLAINRIARQHLLAKGGPIDRAMAAGSPGTQNAMRVAYAKWDWSKHTLHADLETRGLKGLRNYHYEQDALAIHGALHKFVHAFVSAWYRNGQDVCMDEELQDFLREVSSPYGGDIPGFPRAYDDAGPQQLLRIDTTQKLVDLVTDLIFRAGPQHAAVNNGQFDTYGEIANGPGMLRIQLPDDTSNYTEETFWASLPDKKAALGQAGMVWILSLPTRRNLLYIGEFPSFDPRTSFEITEAIVALRRRLQTISYEIQARNLKLPVPYRYLDPQNVSLSTDV